MRDIINFFSIDGEHTLKGALSGLRQLLATQGWINSFLGARFFGRTSKMARIKMGAKKPKCTSDRNTTRNIAFCSLLPK